MKVFEKEYHGFESWIDMSRDIDEIWYEPTMKNVPSEGRGTLKITVEYIPSEEDEEVD